MVSFCLCNQSINLKNGWEPRDSEGSMGREDSSCLSSFWRGHRWRTSGSSLCRWMNCLILSVMTPLKYIIVGDASNCSPCFNNLTFAKRVRKHIPFCWKEDICWFSTSWHDQSLSLCNLILLMWHLKSENAAIWSLFYMLFLTDILNFHANGFYNQQM